MSETWKCPTCGEKYRADVPICRNCRTPSIIRREGLTGVRRPLSRTKSEPQIPAAEGTPPPPSAPAPTPAPAPPPADAPVEVHFPVVLKDVRYSLPVVTGEVWTSGWVVAIAEGIYLVSEEDGLDPKELAARSAPPEGHLARHSVFFNRDSILRIARGENLVGEFLQARGGQVALRLSADAWEELDVIREALGISG